MKPRRRRSWLLVAAVYVAALAAGWWGLGVVRERVVADLSRPEAQADWQAWKAKTAEQAASGPVLRRPIKADEPPLLILFRDHYAGILAVSFAVGTFLIWFLGFLIVGMGKRSWVLSPQAESAAK